MVQDLRIVLFADLHGNLEALEAFLEIVKSERPCQLYCLGDLVGYGAHPNEVIDVIRRLGIPTILGNYDEGVGFEKGDCGCHYPTKEAREAGRRSYEFTVREVTEENKAFLRSLPRELSVSLGGALKMHLVHGSPRRINEYLLPERPPHSFERIAALERVAGYVALGFGHTHVAWHRVFGETLFIAVGSLGKPKGEQLSPSYTVLVVPEGAQEAKDIAVYERSISTKLSSC